MNEKIDYNMNNPSRRKFLSTMGAMLAAAATAKAEHGTSLIVGGSHAQKSRVPMVLSYPANMRK